VGLFVKHGYINMDGIIALIEIHTITE